MADETHTPRSDVEIQAEAFRNCFESIPFRLDKHFSWMTESQREELGRKADRALKQAYIDHFSEMYGGEENT